MKVHVKTKDEVIVISGKDKGTKGKVLAVNPKSGRVTVEGVAMVTIVTAGSASMAASDE